MSPTIKRWYPLFRNCHQIFYHECQQVVYHWVVIRWLFTNIQRIVIASLKLTIDKQLMLHNDVYPNKVCPAINRSFFIGLGDRDGGLWSRWLTVSPKLHVSFQYYCGHMTQQDHPLMRYKKPDHPSVHNEMAEQQQHDGSVAEILTNKLEDNMLESNQTVIM